MKKVFLVLLLLPAILLAGKVLAEESLSEGFVGPGGCESKEECRAYCDIDANKEECLNFALEKGLMTAEEVEKARKFLNQTGPGGCKGDDCRDYCEDPANTEECIRFAEESGIIKPGEGEKLRKLREIETKGGPGGCKGEECRDYCEDEAHMEECFTFARENGLVGEEEIKNFEVGLKIKKGIKEQGGPGGCRSEEECHNYCSSAERLEECVAFGATQTGLPPEEIRRMLEEFKEGGGPREFERPDPDEYRQRFEDYRRQFEDRDREFEDRGREFEGVQEMRMMESRGPGGCDSEESCRAYCMANPSECGFGPREGEEQHVPMMQEEYMMPPSGEYMMPPSGEYTMPPPGGENLMYPIGEEYMMPPPPPPEFQMPVSPEPIHQETQFEQLPPPEPVSLITLDRLLANILSVFSRMLMPR